MTKTRLEAFSDGVIAIIITIMVLELKIPHGQVEVHGKMVDGASWEALIHLWPNFLSYLLSFVMLGIYWGNHHHLIHTIHEVRGGILWANLHLLFWLSLMPFATAWMGENNFSKVTLILFCVVSTMAGLAYFILLTTIRRCTPPSQKLQQVLAKQSKKGAMSVIFYVVAIAGAFIHPAVAAFFIVLVAVWWLLPDRNIEKAIDHNEHHS